VGLVWCLENTFTFVTPEPKSGATLRAASLFASAFVPRSSQTHGGMLVARASVEAKMHGRKCKRIFKTPHLALADAGLRVWRAGSSTAPLRVEG